MKKLSFVAIIAMFLVSLVSCDNEGTVLSGKTYVYEEGVGTDMYIGYFLEFGAGYGATLTMYAPGLTKDVDRGLRYSLSEDNIVELVYGRGPLKGQKPLFSDGIYDPVAETIVFDALTLSLQQ